MTGRLPEPVVTVFAHVFYPEVWAELAGELARVMPVPFRVIVTTPLDAPDLAVPDTALLTGQTVLRAENRGRDVLPFLAALEAAGPFPLGLKLHTKRSPHRADGDEWRRVIVESLLPSREGVGAVLRAFEAEPHLGLVAPSGLLLRLRNRSHGNWGVAGRVARRLGTRLSLRERYAGLFPAGSMFWFRSGALAGLSRAALDDLFEPETGQLDATAAHAVERLFAVHAARRGFAALPADALTGLVPGLGLRGLRRAGRRAARREHPIVWQMPPLLMAVRRTLPLAFFIVRHIPKPLRKGLRRLVGEPR